MNYPIVIVEIGDIDIDLYNSVEEAQQSMEVVDVSNNEYMAYDAKGNLLRLKIIKKERKSFFGNYFIDLVKISNPIKQDKKSLIKILEQYLSYIDTNFKKYDDPFLYNKINKVLKNLKD